MKTLSNLKTMKEVFDSNGRFICTPVNYVSLHFILSQLPSHRNVTINFILIVNSDFKAPKIDTSYIKKDMPQQNLRQFSQNISRTMSVDLCTV